MRRPVGWLLFLVAIIVSAVLVAPYLSLDSAGSRLEVSAGLHYFVLVAHVFTAAVALVAGPLQFLARVRARRPVHRLIGRIYLFAGVLPAAVTAVPVAWWSGRVVTQIGLTTAAVLWLITGGLAYRAARRGDFAGHREWMMRNYALTFLAVTSRALVPLLLLAQVPFTDGDVGSIGRQAAAMIPIGQTAGWIINLLVVESLLRRSRRRARPVTETRAVRPAGRRSRPAG